MNKLFLSYLESVSNLMTPMTIYIDMDGVLADLDGKQHDFIEKNYNDIFNNQKLQHLTYLSEKEKKDILKNIFNKNNKNVSNNDISDIKQIYWQKFIEQKCFEKLKVLPQVKTLSQTIKQLKEEYSDLKVEILGSTGNPENHHAVVNQKEKWLKMNSDKIGIVFDRYIFVPGRKLKQNHANKNSVLIDDTASNCHEFKNAGGMAYHVDNNMTDLVNKLKIYLKGKQ